MNEPRRGEARSFPPYLISIALYCPSLQYTHIGGCVRVCTYGRLESKETFLPGYGHFSASSPDNCFAKGVHVPLSKDTSLT